MDFFINSSTILGSEFRDCFESYIQSCFWLRSMHNYASYLLEQLCSLMVEVQRSVTTIPIFVLSVLLTQLSHLQKVTIITPWHTATFKHWASSRCGECLHMWVCVHESSPAQVMIFIRHLCSNWIRKQRKKRTEIAGVEAYERMIEGKRMA